MKSSAWDNNKIAVRLTESFQTNHSLLFVCLSFVLLSVCLSEGVVKVVVPSIAPLPPYLVLIVIFPSFYSFIDCLLLVENKKKE